MEKLRLLNPDILELVLSKLQTKDLLRMKCVSKSWRDLIRERSFALRHSRLRLPPVSEFLFQKNLEWEGLGVSAVSYISAERKEVEKGVFWFSGWVGIWGKKCIRGDEQIW
ncbi:unnamed protein product [Linum trigynum]|uniref:F-box domain-containing protein n=1 Tax=Linum trigynum TaxID=586398 RepID=A0AAV2G573_9ROSI